MLSSLRDPLFKRRPSFLPPPLIPPSPFSFFPSFIAESKQSSSRLGSTLSRNLTTSSTTSSTACSDTYTNALPTTSSYFSVRVLCRKDVADMLSDALFCFGASSASMDETEKCGDTDEVCISSIFTECQDVNTCISHAADSIGLEQMPSYEVLLNEQCDWVKKSQESFHAVEVAEGFWIVPEWESPPNVQATNIILNPGLAFGTGDHPTTKLCLLFLRDLIRGGELFLDYGTGSGILAIAALKLGVSLSVGVDIDPEAINSARQNAALNNIGPEKMHVYLIPGKTSPSANGSPSVGKPHSIDMEALAEKYDIVIANVLLNPLLELADHILAYAKPGAAVAVSGILSEQLPQIEERYSPYLESISVSEIDGWACLSGTKKRI